MARDSQVLLVDMQQTAGGCNNMEATATKTSKEQLNSPSVVTTPDPLAAATVNADTDTDMEDEGAGPSSLPGEQANLWDDIFTMVRPHDWTAEEPEPPGLKCSMYGFQRRALAWMALREKGGAPQDNGAGAHGDGATSSGCTEPPLRGGILADEMGLGKTVEVLALLLHHPRKPPAAEPLSEPTASPTQGSAGTLIVCPATILQQWKSEVEKHTSLRVHIYEGLKWHRLHTEGMQKKKKKVKQAPQDQWENLSRLVERGAAAGEVAYDAEAEAAAMAVVLAGADVVLTSYDVLKQDVHFSPEESRSKNLRHAKRYRVPESPLVAASWQRLVLDEAQEVKGGGGFGVVARMAARMRAQCRWCVTGTPLGPGGLDDLQGLLAALQLRPWADAATWRSTVAAPYLAGEPGAYERLRGVLRPLMWRNCKASVADEHRLPPRSLRTVRPRFSEAEASFYAHLLERTRAARDAVAQCYAQAAEAGLDGSPNKQDKKRRKAEQAGAAALKAATGELLQLRLACTHPQLTLYWRHLSAELQLEQGGALSMAEIMQRMADGVQLQLQNAERELCLHLNAQAAQLLAGLPAPGAASEGAAAQPQAGATGRGAGEPSSSGGAASPTPPKAKRRRESSSGKGSQAGGGQPSPIGAAAEAELLHQALQILQRSRRVGEDGISVMDAEDFAGSFNISAANASIRAWRLTQVHTLQMLADVYERLGRSAEAAEHRDTLRHRVDSVRETADGEVAKAHSRVSDLEARIKACEVQLAAEWGAAVRAGWDPGHEALPPAVWVQSLKDAVADAQVEEKAKRGAIQMADGSLLETVLGTVVQSRLKDWEEGLLGRRARLEAAAGLGPLRAALACLRAAMQIITGRQGGSGNGAPALPRLDKVPEEVILWRALACTDLEGVTRAATAARQNSSAYVLEQVKKQVRRASRMLEKQEANMAAQLEGTDGGGVGVGGAGRQAAADNALAAVRAQVELVRLMRERHTAHCQVELHAFNVNSVEEEVMAAARGVGGRGSHAAAKSGAELQRAAEAAQKLCVELRARQRYLHHQLRQAGGEVSADFGAIFDDVHIKGGRDAAAAGRVVENGQGGSLGEEGGEDGQLIVQGEGQPGAGRESDAGGGSVGVETASQQAGELPADVAMEDAGATPVGQQPVTAASLSPDPGARSADRFITSEEAVDLTGCGDRSDASAQPPVHLARHPGAGGLSHDEMFFGVRAETGLALATRDFSRLAARPVPVTNVPVFGGDTVAHAEDDVVLLTDGKEEVPKQRDEGGTMELEPDQGQAVEEAGGAAQVGQAAGRVSAGANDEEEQHKLPTCPVCLLDIDGIIQVVSCGHLFCESCMATLERERKTCPMCRHPIKKNQVFRVAPATHAHVPTDDFADDPQLAKIRVQGAFGTKLEALLRRILRLRQVAPQDKSLVFSQFPAALQLVGLALSANGIGHVQLAGARASRKALLAFAGNPDIRVMLLALRTGAAGLTLTNAAHVFLLEPAADPAIEQQAVARVHRIGQQRPVTVTRLLIAGTVEEEVLKAQERRQLLFSEAGGGGSGEDGGLGGQLAPRQEVVGREEMIGLLASVLDAAPRGAKP